MKSRRWNHCYYCSYNYIFYHFAHLLLIFRVVFPPPSSSAFVLIHRHHPTNVRHPSPYCDRCLLSWSDSSTHVSSLSNSKYYDDTDDSVSKWNQIQSGLAEGSLRIPLIINMTHSIYELRHLQEEDILSATQMIAREYGTTYPISQSSNTHDSFAISIHFLIESLVSVKIYMENWIFCFIVSVGLLQRIQRRKVGQETSQHDHNVLCLFECRNKNNNNTWTLVGMTELSIQPLNPYHVSSPYIIPSYIKRLSSQITQTPQIAYVSNVLVQPTYRGRGYSKLLMMACENLAYYTWKYTDIYLHVDADVKNGLIAQSLYLKLGYKPVSQQQQQQQDGDTTWSQRYLANNNSFSWMGTETIQTDGLYFIDDDIPLLYMRKNLKDYYLLKGWL